MFIYTGEEVINSNRITMVGVETERVNYFDCEPCTWSCVYIEVGDGLVFNEWDGHSAPDFRRIRITKKDKGEDWAVTCYDLVKSIYTATGGIENFDVEEWLMDRELRKGAEEINEMIKARKNK